MVTGKTWLHNNGLIVKQLRSLGVPLWDEVAEATVFLWSNNGFFFLWQVQGSITINLSHES